MLQRALIALFVTLSVVSCRHFSPDQKQVSASIEAADSAKSLIGSGDYREALRQLLRANDYNPASAEVHYLLATVYLVGFNRLDDAKTNALSAIDLAKAPYPEAENLTGAIFIEMGQPSAALSYLQRAASNLLYDTPYLAEQNLGRAYAELGKGAESVKHYAKAITAQPSLCSAYLPYTEQLMSLLEYQKAEQSLLQFSKRCDANDAEAQETLRKVRAILQK